jgi:hypothetical protein
MVIVVILNAARNSLSWFMLIIVALGYGVVKPTLGSTMKLCISLSFVYFVCNTLYTAGILVADRNNPVMVLLFVVPLALTMTVFYVWTLSALSATMQHLVIRRQTHKVKMYRNLWRLLMGSVGIIAIFLVVTTINFRQIRDAGFYSDHWMSLWFLTDGWTSILYLSVFVVLAFIWRPTQNNARYPLILAMVVLF